MSETPRTDAVEAEFLGGRSLSWLDVAAKSAKVFSEMRNLERALHAAEARVDALMLEYCPEEMTLDQKARWAAHQKPAKELENAAPQDMAKAKPLSESHGATVAPASAAPQNAAVHVATDECEFDRNGSHSAGHYVCMCGWEDAPAAPDEGMPECDLPSLDTIRAFVMLPADNETHIRNLETAYKQAHRLVDSLRTYALREREKREAERLRAEGAYYNLTIANKNARAFQQRAEQAKQERDRLRAALEEARAAVRDAPIFTLDERIINAWEMKHAAAIAKAKGNVAVCPSI